MIKIIDKNKIRIKKMIRTRKKIKGSSERPRMSVFRANKNIYVQIIDDSKGITLVSSSTLSLDIKDKDLTSNIESAKIVGKDVGEKALKKGIKKVVFDRSGYKYTGLIKELADSARSAGLDF